MVELDVCDTYKVSAGVNAYRLIAGITVGAVTGAIRGIPGGPLGIIGSAIFGGAMGAAGIAMHDGAELAAEREKSQ